MCGEREGESDQSIVQTEVRALTNSILNAADFKKDELFPLWGTTEMGRTLHLLWAGDEGRISIHECSPALENSCSGISNVLEYAGARRSCAAYVLNSEETVISVVFPTFSSPCRFPSQTRRRRR